MIQKEGSAQEIRKGHLLRVLSEFREKHGHCIYLPHWFDSGATNMSCLIWNQEVAHATGQLVYASTRDHSVCHCRSSLWGTGVAALDAWCKPSIFWASDRTHDDGCCRDQRAQGSRRASGVKLYKSWFRCTKFNRTTNFITCPSSE